MVHGATEQAAPGFSEIKETIQGQCCPLLIKKGMTLDLWTDTELIEYIFKASEAF